MAEEFKDTVRFSLKSGLSDEARTKTLDDIAKIRGVFALQAAAEPDTYDVGMNGEDEAASIGCQIARRDAVQTTTITPAEFHALTAKIAAQGPSV